MGSEYNPQQRLSEYLASLECVVGRCGYKTSEGKCGVGRVDGGVCPATNQLGVYDNWPILLHADPERVIDDFIHSGKYRLSGRQGRDQMVVMEYVPGTVRLEFYKELEKKLFTGGANGGFGVTSGMKVHRLIQADDFEMGIELHQDLPRKMRGKTKNEALAEVIRDIGNYALSNKIPLCFPQSIGWQTPDDCNQIIYYRPSKRAKISVDEALPCAREVGETLAGVAV